MSPSVEKRSWWGGKRRVEDRAMTAGNVPAVMLSGGTGQPVNRDAALRIADVFSAVRCLSDSAASLPLHAYRRADGGRERYTGRLADLIDRPAPATTTANLVGQLVAHLALDGNTFLAKYRDPDGQIIQLGALDPTRVTVALERGEPVYALSRPDGVTTRHGVEDIIHLRAMSVDGLVGLSPIRQARQALGLARSLGGWPIASRETVAGPRASSRSPRAAVPRTLK